MSKAVSADHEFNIEKYAALLEKAKGGRTQTEFAKDCGLSTAYMCKHLNKRIDKSPIPSTLKKIAAVAANGVSYEDLLDAAGYDASKYSTIRDSDSSPDRNKRTWGLEFEKLGTATITTALSKSNLKWTIKGTSDKAVRYDLEVEIIDDKITNWYFNFITANREAWGIDKDSLLNRLFHNYGKLVLMPAGINIKYSFVTDSQTVYEMLKANTPSALAMYISLILIDTSTLTVIKEEYVKTAFSDKLDDLVSLS
ncbi:MAG: hypothetical protein J6I76_18910 [Oribacterium sp.]|nr:hypothetical protein [Oribacterium sp.]